MGATSERTGAFENGTLNRGKCPDCGGTGELRIDSENITENFEVENQIVITPCPRCDGTGYLPSS